MKFWFTFCILISYIILIGCDYTIESNLTDSQLALVYRDTSIKGAEPLFLQDFKKGSYTSFSVYNPNHFSVTTIFRYSVQGILSEEKVQTVRIDRKETKIIKEICINNSILGNCTIVFDSIQYHLTSPGVMELKELPITKEITVCKQCGNKDCKDDGAICTSNDECGGKFCIEGVCNNQSRCYGDNCKCQEGRITCPDNSKCVKMNSIDVGGTPECRPEECVYSIIDDNGICIKSDEVIAKEIEEKHRRDIIFLITIVVISCLGLFFLSKAIYNFMQSRKGPIIKEAEEEVSRIKDEAKQKADAILQKAREQEENIMKQAKENKEKLEKESKLIIERINHLETKESLLATNLQVYKNEYESKKRILVRQQEEIDKRIESNKGTKLEIEKTNKELQEIKSAQVELKNKYEVKRDKTLKEIDLINKETETKYEQLLKDNLEARGMKVYAQYELNHAWGKNRYDLAIPDWKLLIEVDGSHHKTDEGQILIDKRRKTEAHTQGWRILRFTNHQVFEKLPIVIERIKRYRPGGPRGLKQDYDG